MGGFIAIPELCESSVGIVELFPNRIHQCLYYPQCKAMTSEGKHGYSKYRFNILLPNASKKSDLSTQQLQNSRFLWQFISCIETRLMTTYDRSQCPELISNYDFNGHCPRVKFVYYVNKYLLVASFKLETAEIIRNSVTKDAFVYVPIHKFLNIYFSLSVLYLVTPCLTII